MGGDAFEGVEKLTNHEYNELVPEILTAIQELCICASSYIPLPEKEVHGDIDILLILKPGSTEKSILEKLKIEKFILNHNSTINTVYKNKQVDFCIKKNEIEYEFAKFYKSYSGIGAHLGLCLPSKEVKLSDSGLFALAYQEHIKYECLLSKSVNEILIFYGLDPEVYHNGFQDRKSLFEFMRKCRFNDEKSIVSMSGKNNGKLTKFYIQYLQTEVKEEELKVCEKVESPIQMTLSYFNKEKEYKQEFECLLAKLERNQRLNNKYNGSFIMEYFGLDSKLVNKVKAKFRENFKDQEEYLTYIENHDLQEILDRIGKEQDLKAAPEEVRLERRKALLEKQEKYNECKRMQKQNRKNEEKATKKGIKETEEDNSEKEESVNTNEILCKNE